MLMLPDKNSLLGAARSTPLPYSAAGRVAADQTEWWVPLVWPACQAEHLGGSGAAGTPLPKSSTATKTGSPGHDQSHP